MGLNGTGKRVRTDINLETRARKQASTEDCGLWFRDWTNILTHSVPGFDYAVKER